MERRHYLNPGQMFFGSGVLVETLLGSCVAITLWFPMARQGGICHFMLPQRQRELRLNSRGLDGRYGREAWLWLCQQARAQLLDLSLAEVKLFGGARVLIGSPAPERDIGQRNIDLAEACLREAGLRVLARDLGGECHRVLRFDLCTGEIWLRRGAAMPRS